MIDPDAVSLDFLRAELQAGLTFAEVARSGSGTVRERNLTNATAALQTVKKFKSRIALGDAEAAEIDTGIAELAAAIEDIPSD